MKLRNIAILALVVFSTLSASAQKGIEIENLTIERIGGDAYGGGKVWVNFDVTVFNDYNRGSVTVLSPILYSGGENVVLPDVVVATRKSEILLWRDDVMVPEGSFIMRPREKVGYVASVSYEDWMNGASLKLLSTTRHCTNYIVNAGNTLASNVVMAKTVFEPYYAMARPAKEKRKKRSKGGAMFLEFAVGSSVVKANFRSNSQELKKITDRVDGINCDQDTRKIRNIELWGTCSPEGSYEFNAKLAAKRTEAVKDFVMSHCDMDEDLFVLTSTPEDWKGLRAAVRKSSLENKEQILAIAGSKESYATRDAQMKRLKNYQLLLKEYYPPLRRVNYKVNYDVVNYNESELMSAYKRNPKNLSERELYRLGQLNPNQRDGIVMTAAELYPNSASANLNMAVVLLQSGRMEEADSYLKRAASLIEINQKTATAELVAVYYNTSGIYHMMMGDSESAELLFEKAAGFELDAARMNLQEIL